MAKIDEFLRTMIESKGSDLHLCSCQPPKIRVHGDLQALPVPPISPDEMRGILKEICPDNKWEWYETNLDQDLAYEIPGLARFRVNFLNNHFAKLNYQYISTAAIFFAVIVYTVVAVVFVAEKKWSESIW